MTTQTTVPRASKPLRWGLAILGIALHGVALAAPPVYRVVELPVSPPGVCNINSVRTGQVNNAGDVVGLFEQKRPCTSSLAVYWDGASGALSVLKTDVQSPGLSAYLINDAKVIVGSNWASKRGGKFYSITWDSPWNSSTRLPLLDSRASAEHAYGINNSGVIVGRTVFGLGVNNRYEATMWSPGGSVTSLGYLPKAQKGTVPEAINDAGVVVGSATFDADPSIAHPFMWTPATGIFDLGVVPGTEFTYASGINNAGQVIATAGAYSQLTARHVYIWTQATGYQDLGTLPNAQDVDSLYPRAINNTGVVIGGYRYIPTNKTFGYLWTAESGMLDLRTLIDPADPLKASLMAPTTELYLSGVNDAGAIVGYAYLDPSDSFSSVPLLFVPVR
jgi:probable HAF family extracellular repeat protein